MVSGEILYVYAALFRGLIGGAQHSHKVNFLKLGKESKARSMQQRKATFLFLSLLSMVVSLANARTFMYLNSGEAKI